MNHRESICRKFCLYSLFWQSRKRTAVSVSWWSVWRQTFHTAAQRWMIISTGCVFSSRFSLHHLHGDQQRVILLNFWYRLVCF